MQSKGPGVPAALIAGVPADVLQQLQPRYIDDLLQAALANELQLGTGQCLQAVCGLPAAQVLDADSVCRLLQTAVQHPDATAAAALCELAGAQQIDEHSICSLLVEALASGGYQKVEALVLLAAAQSLTADALLPIAVAAVCSSESQPLSVLLRLPAAAGLSGAAINTLLHAAVDAVGRSGEAYAVHVAALCGLDGAAAAGSKALVAALHAAIASCSSDHSPCSEVTAAVVKVCTLMAKQQCDVSAAQLAALLKAAHSKRMSHYVWMLLNLPQALQLQEALVADVLQQVLQDSMSTHASVLVSGAALRKCRHAQ
jgi:hypothetical protein